ncbi:PREDICTED: craniofacial development protein 1-like [Rhagoletis zephyria]|uniref:craniofacial development protein 1-like n=1 Tax=Rhagoletis zephyria TaxID=28612 RepID=UPI000811696B|nr:PREDICTED: craniofacial development protein 1-like [Rhagoletis zephyria]
MNRHVELHDSDESDSDFCPEKDAGNEVSEEASTEPSSCSEAEESCENSPQQQKRKKNRGHSRKSQTKKLKGRKSTRAQDKKRTSDTDEESSTADAERRRNTRQTELSKRLCSSKEKDTLESEEEDKSRSDALWADFLSDVKPEQTEKVTKSQTNTSSNDATSNGRPETAAKNGRKRPKDEDKSEEKSTSQEKPPVAKKQEKHAVTEVLDFAGEEVHVEKVVNSDSVKENKETVVRAGTSTLRADFPTGLKRPMAGGSGSGGLGSLLNQIGKKKKISVLEKSQLDWKSFKQDEGIEEELQTFNKGKEGFLERQDFLQRTDLRQFEIEKNLRQSRRNN